MIKLSSGVVLVVGAGIAGLCVARELARKGRQVKLLADSEALGASQAATGLLQVAGGRISARHLRLRRACWDAYGSFIDALKQGESTFAWRGTGHLRITRNESAADSFAATLRGLGVPARALSGAHVRALEPALSGEIGGAVLLSDGRVDPDALLLSLRSSLRELGVEIVDARVTAVKDATLRDAEGRVWRGEKVVLACGAGLAALHRSGWAFRQDPGSSVTFTGSLPLTHSLELAGLGETLVPLSSDRWKIGGSLDAQGDLLRNLRWKGEETARTVGVRSTAPDGLPVVGAAGNSLYLLGGLGRSGLLTAPLLANGLAEEILSGVCPPWMSPFSPLREGIGQRRPWSR